MIRPIKLTEEVIEECVEEFRKTITESRMYNGTLSYNKTFKWTDKVPPAILKITAEAYMKMRLLLETFSSEVAWQFVTFRDDVDPNVFHLTDIVVEPQVVTGVTVDTDQEEYEKWLMSLPDEVFNNLHANCHSHVNMATTPSGTDKNHWTSVLNSLSESVDDVFQIFMIWNKRMEKTVQVYDLKNNVYYDDKDVVVEIEDFDGWGLNEFLKTAKDSVKTAPSKPAYQSNPYYSGGYYGGYNGGYQKPSTPAQTVIPLDAAKEEKAKKDRTAEAKARKEEKRAQRESGYYSGAYWDDDDDYWDDRYSR